MVSSMAADPRALVSRSEGSRNEIEECSRTHAAPCSQHRALRPCCSPIESPRPSVRRHGRRALARGLQSFGEITAELTKIRRIVVKSKGDGHLIHSEAKQGHRCAAQPCVTMRETGHRDPRRYPSRRVRNCSRRLGGTQFTSRVVGGWGGYASSPRRAPRANPRITNRARTGRRLGHGA